MARKRPAPSTSSPASESPGEGRRDEQAKERFGPLDVERHVKDDGRALILFAHAEREHS
jgi:hypothetical protein